MNIRSFLLLLREIGPLTALEFGQDDETPLTGEAAFALAKRLFPRG